MQIRPNKISIAPRHGLMRNAWLKVLDLLVRVLSLGSARVVPIDRIAPIKWNGVIKSEAE